MRIKITSSSLFVTSMCIGSQSLHLIIRISTKYNILFGELSKVANATEFHGLRIIVYLKIKKYISIPSQVLASHFISGF
jgi:hypothetical protein